MPSLLTESYWPADVSVPLREQTIADLLRNGVATFPDRIALVDGQADATRRRTWTYAQLLDAAERVAHALLERFSPGARVAIWSPNCAEWVILQQGLSLAGLVMVALNPSYRRQEPAYALRQSRAAGLFFAESYRGFDMAALIHELGPELLPQRLGGLQDPVGVVRRRRLPAHTVGQDPKVRAHRTRRRRSAHPTSVGAAAGPKRGSRFSIIAFTPSA